MSLLNRLRWYKDRLAAMSAAEIIYRLREAMRRKLDRLTSARLAVQARDYGALPELPGLRAGLDAWQVPPELIVQWEEQARIAQSGEYFMFGVKWPACPRDQLWHLDPITNSLWPRDAFCFAIDYRHNNKKGDIKFVWELNRLHFLQPVAALAYKRNDKNLAQFCLSKIENWIDANPPFCGVNWNSGIELALRAISIMTVTTLTGEYLSRATRGKIWSSLHTHARWIARYPSRYSSANNHRAAEGLGLFVIGALCPHFAEAAAWKQTGWDILCDVARRQILPDGAGAEQSVGYAASLLEILLTGLKVAQAVGLDVPDFYLRKITLGGDYLRWLTDAANNLPQIGDDDNACIFGACRAGDAYAASVLGCVAAVTSRADLTPPCPTPHMRQAFFGFAPAGDFAPYGARSFAHGGMTVGRHKNAQGDILLAFDHGPLGYLSIAAHGHADALALWLHIGGQPVLIDAGTYLYHAQGDERRYFRGTAAHNTLTVADTDASMQAGHFNWSRKAQTVLRHFSSRGDFWQVEAEHDGYLEPFHCLHRRSLSVSPASGAVIEDELIGSEPVSVGIHFLLHPDLTARREGREIMILQGERLLLRLRHESGLEPSLEQAWYSPSFGIRTETTRLRFSGVLAPGEKAVTHLFWRF